MITTNSSNTPTSNAIIDAAIQAFNNRGAVKTNQLSPMEKALLVTNYPLYTDVGPYNFFYRACVALSAAVDKEHTKATFNLSDAQIDALSKRVKTSLETGHAETWSAINEVSREIKRMAYAVPELAQVKPIQEKKSDVQIRSYRPVKIEPLVLREPSAPKNNAVEFSLATLRKNQNASATVFESKPIKPAAKPTKDMAIAASPSQDYVETTPQKKRAELTLPKEITGLTLPVICTKLQKLFDTMGYGDVSNEQLSSKKYATATTLQLRSLIAYTATRVMPATNYNIERIATASFLNRQSVSSVLNSVFKKVENNDEPTIKFLRAAGEELPLTSYQKALLFDTKEPRFKTWIDLQNLVRPTALSSLQTPEGP
jgi:hypothetical protein